MKQGPLTPTSRTPSKLKLLKEAKQDIEKAYELFKNPKLSLGLSYDTLLKTIGHHPALVKKLLKASVLGMESDDKLLTLMDGRDLVLLGAGNQDTMAYILKDYNRKLVGADLLECAKLYPELARTVFEQETLRSRLSGQQLATLGSYHPDIAQAIKADERLWRHITVHKDVAPMIEILNEEKAERKIDTTFYNAMVAKLTQEEKTLMNVGILCQNNPELANQLVQEGFLNQLNGEDLSSFAQHHPAIIDKILKTPELMAKIEGNDFKRLGLNSEKASHAILVSKPWMVKAGPYVWAELSARHDFFGGEFMQAFDMAVRQYLDKKAKHDKNPTTKAPVQSELMRFNAEFLILLAQKRGPAFAEYLYDQAVRQNNPVYRYVFKLDDHEPLQDVEGIVAKMKASLKASGMAEDSPLFIARIMVLRENLEAKNKQIQNAKYTYLNALASISPKCAHMWLDDILKFPKYLDEISGAHLKTIANKDASVIRRILDTPELAKKCSGTDLAQMAKVSSKLLEKIWTTPEFKQKIINSRNITLLCGRYLNVILEAADNKGFMDDIIEAMKQSKNLRDKEIPKGYIAYLYNHLYPRAEVIKTIQHLLKEEVACKQKAREPLEPVNAPLTPQFKLSKQSTAPESPPSPKPQRVAYP